MTDPLTFRFHWYLRTETSVEEIFETIRAAVLDYACLIALTPPCALPVPFRFC